MDVEEKRALLALPYCESFYELFGEGTSSTIPCFLANEILDCANHISE